MSSATAKKRKKHCTGGALKTEISQVDVVALLIFIVVNLVGDTRRLSGAWE